MVSVRVLKMQGVRYYTAANKIGLLGVHSFEHDMYGVTIKAEELTDSFR
jgi:hypothetical protein